MIEIKCFKDILILAKKNIVPKPILNMLKQELVRIKSWSDEYNETSLTEFHTDDYDYGYIAILDGSETGEQIKSLGLSDGLAGVIPEIAFNYFIEGEKWTKIIVVYNDSYSMSFWLRNCNLFDSYATTDEDSVDYTIQPF